MQIIEFINDGTLFGIGFFTIQTEYASKSLLGIFWQKEDKELWIDILFVNLKIRT